MSRNSRNDGPIASTDLTLQSLRADYRVLRRAIRSAANPAVTVSAIQPTLAWSTAASTSPLTGGTVRTTPYTSQVSRFVGKPSADTVNSVLGNAINNGDATSIIEEFDFTGTNVAFHWRAISTTPTFKLWVNGAAVSLTPISPSGITVSVGTLYRVALTFASAGTYRIRLEGNLIQRRAFEYVSGDSITPAPSNGDTWVVMGDSWVGGALSIGLFDTFPAQMQNILGSGMTVLNAGQGGTGYTAASNGSKSTYADSARVASAAFLKPDVAVIFGSVNDVSATTSAMQTAAATCYANWYASSPKTKLIVVGIQRTLNSTQESASLPLNAAIQSAALAAPNVIGYTDPLTGYWYSRTGVTGGDGQRWFTIGGGWSTSPASDDGTMLIGSDNVHPTQAGHNYVARRVLRDALDMLVLPAN